MKQQGKSFSEQEERAELIPSAPWQSSCQPAGSLGCCWGFKAKQDMSGALSSCLVFPWRVLGSPAVPSGIPSFLASIPPSLHKESFMEQVSDCSSPSFSLQLACPKQGCATLATSAALQGELLEMLALSGSQGLLLGQEVFSSLSLQGPGPLSFSLQQCRGEESQP